VSIEMQAGESIREATSRVIREQLAGALDSLANKEPDTLDERVHSVRKNFKRVRALLRLVRRAVTRSAYQAENQSFRDAGRPLAGARDANVLIDALESLREKAGDQCADSFAAAKQLLVKRRDAVRGNLLEADGAWAATESAVKEALIRWDGEGQIKIANRPKKIRQGLKAIYRRGRRAFGRAKRKPSVERLHEWRKQVKYLRHSLELLTPLRPPVYGSLARHADELGELLGSDHDLAVLGATLQADESHAATDSLQPLIEVQRLQLQSNALERGSDLYRKRPRRFVRGLPSRLKKWRNQSATAAE
jgi:CHAD domain-containing protein